jgi:tRNA threonylcarbamoyladenosine biosynthesis protein TsaB
VIVLGFDTATAATAVGLALADGSTLQARDDPEGERRPGHATRLLPLADGLLLEAGLGWSELERLAVGVGPGTFTGLRIGVATARALAQSLEVDLAGVSSLRALAYGAGERAAVLSVIDARRGEVFVAGYVGEQEVLAPRAVPPDDMGDLLERAASDLAVEQWVALGDGAVRYRDAFERLGVSVPTDRAECHRIQATAICELGSHLPASSSSRSFVHTDADPPTAPSGSAQIGEKAVVPDYLRRPDAEVALEGVA